MRWLQLSDLFYRINATEEETKIKEEFFDFLKDQNFNVEHLFCGGPYRTTYQSTQNVESSAKELCSHILKIAALSGVNDPTHIHFSSGNEDLHPDFDYSNAESALMNKANKLLYLAGVRDFGYGINPYEGLPCSLYDNFNILYIDSPNYVTSDDIFGNLSHKVATISSATSKIMGSGLKKPVLVFAKSDFYQYGNYDKLYLKSTFSNFPNLIYLHGTKGDPYAELEVNLSLDDIITSAPPNKNYSFLVGEWNGVNFSVRTFIYNGFWKEDTENTPPKIRNQVVANQKANELTLTPVLFESANFKGRQKEIESVKQGLDTHKIVLIHSKVGGIGKSEISRYLYHEIISGTHKKFKKVAWIEFNESLTRSFFKKFKHISNYILPKDYQTEVGKQLDQEDTLLILDNANKISQKDLAFLHSLKCATLLTSRVEKTGTHTIYLGKLSTKENRDLYFDQIDFLGEKKPELEAAVDYICKSVGYLPLTIKLVAKAQVARAKGIMEMKSLLNEQKMDYALLQETIDQNYSEKNALEDINETILMSLMSKIFALSDIQKSVNQMRILFLFSLLKPNVEISFASITRWFSLDHADDINQLENNHWLIKTKTPQQISYSIHPVIAEVVRNNAVFSHYTSDIVHLVRNLANDLDYSVTESLANRLEILPLGEHLLQLDCVIFLQNTEFFADYTRLLANVARNLNEYMVFGKELDYIKLAIEIDTKNEPMALLPLAIDYRYKANIHFYRRSNAFNGELEEGLKAMRLAFNYNRRHLDNYLFTINHINPNPITDRLVHLTYDEIKTQLDITQELFQYCVNSLFFEGMKPAWNEMAITCNSFGNIFNNMQKKDIAILFFEVAVEILEIVMDKNSMQVALIKNNMASVYLYQGKLQKALDYNQASLDIRLREIDNHKEYIAASFHTKALILQKIALNNVKSNPIQDADIIDVVKSYHCACVLRKSLFGLFHKEIASIYANLSAFYENASKLELAYYFSTLTYQVNLNLWGQYHSYTKNAENNMNRILALLP